MPTPIQIKRLKGRRTLSRHKDRIFRAILVAYRTGRFTIQSCCESAGTTYDTFHGWMEQDPAFLKRYQDVQDQMAKNRKGVLKELAWASLQRLVIGEEYDEITKEAVPNPNAGPGQPAVLVTKVKTTRIKVQPNPSAVAFALKNLEPETFKEKTTQEISGPDGGPVPVAPQVVNFIIPDNGRAVPGPTIHPDPNAERVPK